MHRHTPRAIRAFTLIELMIVVSILLVLVAVVAISFSSVFGKSRKAQAQATLSTLTGNIDSYQIGWGGYPPGNLERLGLLIRLPELTDANDHNRGIETMVLALRMGVKGGPFLDSELFGSDARRGNLDEDSADAELLNDAYMSVEGSAELFEILDPWGNPYVYVNIGELKQGIYEETITLANGEQVTLDLTSAQDRLKHPITGAYPKNFMIWSFGPDQINDYGRGDDITSWPKYDDEDDEDEDEDEDEEKENSPEANK